MVADSVAFVVDRGREAVYDAEHFFDGYRADRDYALATLRAARQAGARDPRPVRHQRRHADGRAGRHRRRRPDVPRGGPGRARRDLGHPHPQRRRAGGGQLDRRGPGGGPPRPGDHQRLRRAVRQREHGLDPRQPRAQDARDAGAGGRRRPRRADPAQPGGRRDREPGAQRLPAVRRPVGVRAQGRRPRRGRGQGRAQPTSTSIPAPWATPAGSSCPSWAAGPTPRSGRGSWGTSSRASSIRASSRS